MKVVGFVQNYNNVSNGFLEMSLLSLSKTCDKIYVYDSASTEDTRELYKKFECIVIYAVENKFWKELYHKQELLSITLRDNPDWICWIDSDAILGKHWECYDRTRKSLAYCDDNGICLLHLHNLNLWRSDSYYRVDQKFNDLWHGVFWKNTGELHYTPTGKLHQKQYPRFFHDPNIEVTASNFDSEDGKLIHFGFARDEEVATKYFRYRSLGQTGWALDRLVDESNLDLRKADQSWFPTWYKSQITDKPNQLFSPSEMSGSPSYEEWTKLRQ